MMALPRQIAQTQMVPQTPGPLFHLEGLRGPYIVRPLLVGNLLRGRRALRLSKKKQRPLADSADLRINRTQKGGVSHFLLLFLTNNRLFSSASSANFQPTGRFGGLSIGPRTVHEAPKQVLVAVAGTQTAGCSAGGGLEAGRSKVTARGGETEGLTEAGWGAACGNNSRAGALEHGGPPLPCVFCPARWNHGWLATSSRVRRSAAAKASIFESRSRHSGDTCAGNTSRGKLDPASSAPLSAPARAATIEATLGPRGLGAGFGRLKPAQGSRSARPQGRRASRAGQSRARRALCPPRPFPRRRRASAAKRTCRRSPSRGRARFLARRSTSRGPALASPRRCALPPSHAPLCCACPSTAFSRRS